MPLSPHPHRTIPPSDDRPTDPPRTLARLLPRTRCAFCDHGTSTARRAAVDAPRRRCLRTSSSGDLEPTRLDLHSPTTAAAAAEEDHLGDRGRDSAPSRPMQGPSAVHRCGRGKPPGGAAAEGARRVARREVKVQVDLPSWTASCVALLEHHRRRRSSPYCACGSPHAASTRRATCLTPIARASSPASAVTSSRCREVEFDFHPPLPTRLLRRAA